MLKPIAISEIPKSRAVAVKGRGKNQQLLQEFLTLAIEAAEVPESPFETAEKAAVKHRVLNTTVHREVSNKSPTSWSSSVSSTGQVDQLYWNVVMSIGGHINHALSEQKCSASKSHT